MFVKVLIGQLCLSICDPMDCSPPGSPVHGILQQRKLEWLPFPSPEDLPDPGINPRSPALQADSLLCQPPGKPINVCETYSISPSFTFDMGIYVLFFLFYC